MGLAERRIGAERGTPVDTGGRMDLGDLERLGAFEGREDRRQPAGQHRLADAGWSDDQEVVSARGRGRERVAGVIEAAYVGEVERFVAVGGEGHGRRRIGWLGPRRFPFEAGVQLPERVGDAYHRAGDQPRFGGVGGGDDHVLDPRLDQCVDERERADDRAYTSVEAELSEHAEAVERARGKSTGRAGERERHRELEACTRFAHRRRREVHGHPLLRIFEAGRQERGAHPFSRLPPGRVGQADDGVAGETPGDVDLDGDDSPVDAFEHGTPHGCEHGRLLLRARARGSGTALEGGSCPRPRR